MNREVTSVELYHEAVRLLPEGEPRVGHCLNAHLEVRAIHLDIYRGDRVVILIEHRPDLGDAGADAPGYYDVGGHPLDIRVLYGGTNRAKAIRRAIDLFDEYRRNIQAFLDIAWSEWDWSDDAEPVDVDGLAEEASGRARRIVAGEGR